MVLGLLSDPFQLSLEDEMFVVERQHVRGRDGYFEDRQFEDSHGGPDGFRTQQLLADAVVYVGLESGLADALPPQFR